MTIETPRLYLREMKEDDFDALYAVLGDTENMRYYPHAFDEAGVRRWISVNQERYRVFGFGLWAVCLKGTGEMVGDCGLTMQNIHGFIRPEIGYHIRPDMQRRGYAREAASAVRDWAFENTPFRVLYAYMISRNIPSASTARSIGMQFVEEYVDVDDERVSVFATEK